MRKKIFCPYCSGFGDVLLLGMPFPMRCRFCNGTGKIEESRREEAELLAAKRRAEPFIALVLFFIFSVIASIIFIFATLL